MNNLNDIVFNPKTGLFENINDPTAKFSFTNFNGKRTKTTYSEKENNKPIICFFRRSGEQVPVKGSSIILSWNTEKATKVVIKFSPEKSVELPVKGYCSFTVKENEHTISIIAKNGRYRTQQTMLIKCRSKYSIKHFFERLLSDDD